ncbi:MAG TPA: zinc-ribbon domain-containing protein, partial [Microbacterium sp.]|nr:zinc-ribbon domain-containing protein [Microbacterium sp.]
MSSAPRCPYCRHFVYFEMLRCPNCDAEIALDFLARQFVGVRDDKTLIDGVTWYTCSNRGWACNWLVREDAPAGKCFSCRLTRTSPASDDTIALEKLAKTEQAKRRLLLQLGDLGLPIRPW